MRVFFSLVFFFFKFSLALRMRKSVFARVLGEGRERGSAIPMARGERDAGREGEGGREGGRKRGRGMVIVYISGEIPIKPRDSWFLTKYVYA